MGNETCLFFPNLTNCIALLQEIRFPEIRIIGNHTPAETSWLEKYIASPLLKKERFVPRYGTVRWYAMSKRNNSEAPRPHGGASKKPAEGDKQLELLLSNPRHPSLVKKMNDPRDIWKGRVTYSYRFTFHTEDNSYVLRKVGTHGTLRNP